MTLRVLLAFACALAIVSPLAVAGDGLPVMKVLGDIGARDINDRGQVVGICGPGPGHACIWEKGVVTDIHDDDFGSYSTAWAVNEQGQVVGFYGDEIAPGGWWERAFIWQDGVMTDLGALTGDEQYINAWDINDRGQVVGEAGFHAGYPFIWEDGVMTELAIRGSPSINNRGQVAAGCRMLQPNGDIIDLAPCYTPSYYYVSPRHINDRGQVVGYLRHAPGLNQFHAFIWEKGVVTDIHDNALGAWSYAEAANERGQVVGILVTATGEYHAFIWEDGVMTDLGSLSGCTRSAAVGINDAGQVVGYCNYSAVMWEP